MSALFAIGDHIAISRGLRLLSPTSTCPPTLGEEYLVVAPPRTRKSDHMEWTEVYAIRWDDDGAIAASVVDAHPFDNRLRVFAIDVVDAVVISRANYADTFCELCAGPLDIVAHPGFTHRTCEQAEAFKAAQ